MKIVFLDIDGILNSHTFYKERSQGSRYEDVGYPYCDIDPEKVKMLNDIDAKFVISSTWRKGKSVKELQMILEWGGFKGEVIDVTDSLTIKYSNKNNPPDFFSYMSVPRGVEIQKWIKDNEELIGTEYYNFNTYVILDDDSDMLYNQRNNFIVVDGYCGLTPSVIYKANYILTGKYK